MDWRQWSFEMMVNTPAITALVPAGSIHGAGSVPGAPKDKPFMVLRLGMELPNAVQSRNGELTVYVHDEPGDYGRIDDILLAVYQTLDRFQVKEPGAVCVEFLEGSQDLFDDGYGTIMRYSSWKLVGA
jgi:hypothetical protein